MHHGPVMNSSGMVPLPVMNATAMMNASQASSCEGCYTVDHGMQRDVHDGHDDMNMDMGMTMVGCCLLR